MGEDSQHSKKNIANRRSIGANADADQTYHAGQQKNPLRAEIRKGSITIGRDDAKKLTHCAALLAFQSALFSPRSDALLRPSPPPEILLQINALKCTPTTTALKQRSRETLSYSWIPNQSMTNDDDDDDESQRMGDQSVWKDHEWLRDTFRKTKDSSSQELKPLLDWLNRRVKLAFCLESALPPAIERQLQAIHATPFCFAVQMQDYNRQKKWENLKEMYGSSWAFHGTRLENLYPILNHGFVGAMNRTALYGAGSYFSTKISVCLTFAPTTPVPQSLQAMGARLSCICICEVINHSSVKKGGTWVTSDTAGKVQVPETYIVVPNNDHARLAYLVFLGLSRQEPVEFSNQHSQESNSHGATVIGRLFTYATLLRVLRKHGFLLLMLLYVCFFALRALR